MAIVGRPSFDPIYEIEEARICNIALGHIGAEVIKDTNEDTKSARACRAVYAQTRDELLRTFPFNFATKITRIPLDPLYPHPMDEFSYAYKAEDTTVFSASRGSDVTPDAIIVVDPTQLELTNDLIGRVVSGDLIQQGSTIVAVEPVNPLFPLASRDITLDRPTIVGDSTGWSLTVHIPILKILEIAANDNNIYEVVGGDAARRILCNIAQMDDDGNQYLEMKYVERVLNPAKFDSMFEHALALRIASKVAIDLTKNAMVVQMMQQEFSAIFQAAKISSNEEKQIDSPDPWWTDRQAVGAAQPVQRR